MRVRSIFLTLAVTASMVVGAAPAGAAVLMCDGLVVTHAGTPGPDVLIGTPGDDVFWGGLGNDRIFGRGGNDTACGGGGNDFIKGQQGVDILLGGPGRDIIFGNAGGDILVGGDGNDILWGGVGPDDLWAGPGHDIVHAGHGNDFAVGGTGNDKLNGSTGADEMFGGQGNDIITGGIGFDDLNGESGNDVITGGPGSDFIAGDAGIDGCRVDWFDVFITCERGNILGGDGGLVNGAASIDVDLTPEFVLPSPDGPSYVLHVNAIPLPGQTMTVSVFDAQQNQIFQGNGQDPLFSNVLIFSPTEPATVSITGAQSWQAAFLKSKVILPNRASVTSGGSDVFGVPPLPNGQVHFISVTVTNNSAQTSVFQIATIGDSGTNLELNTTLAPGQTETFTGTVSAGAEYIAILGGLIEWQFQLPNL